jgi:hypothetical protein
MKQYFSLHEFKKFGKEYLCMKMVEREKAQEEEEEEKDEEEERDEEEEEFFL